MFDGGTASIDNAQARLGLDDADACQRHAHIRQLHTGGRRENELIVIAAGEQAFALQGCRLSGV